MTKFKMYKPMPKHGPTGLSPAASPGGTGCWTLRGEEGTMRFGRGCHWLFEEENPHCTWPFSRPYTVLGFCSESILWSCSHLGQWWDQDLDGTQADVLLRGNTQKVPANSRFFSSTWLCFKARGSIWLGWVWVVREKYTGRGSTGWPCACGEKRLVLKWLH